MGYLTCNTCCIYTNPNTWESCTWSWRNVQNDWREWVIDLLLYLS